MRWGDAYLVGLLSWQCSRATSNAQLRVGLLALVMLLYGLHPALIEPVTWIDCQFDMAATLFMLLGLLVNTCIKHRLSRAIAISSCFFGRMLQGVCSLVPIHARHF